MNIRPLESLTKEELIELIQHERADHCEDILHMVPEGFNLVPVEATEEMHNAARDWSTGKYGKAIGIDASEGCYKAMLAAAPQPDHISRAGKMVPSDRSLKEIKATLAGAKGKERTLTFSAKEVRGLLNIIINQDLRIERFEKKIADHVAQELKKPTDTEVLDWPVEQKNETIEAVKLFSHGRSTTLYKKVTTPTDTEMLDWIERAACRDIDKYGDSSYWTEQFGSDLILDGFREAISKAMRGE